MDSPIIFPYFSHFSQFHKSGFPFLVGSLMLTPLSSWSPSTRPVETLPIPHPKPSSSGIYLLAQTPFMAFGPSHTKTSLLQANPSIHQPAQENPHGEVLELFIQRPQIPTSHLKSTQLPIFFFIPIIPEGSLLQSHTSDGQALFFFFLFFSHLISSTEVFVANTQPFVLIYCHLSLCWCSVAGQHLPATKDTEDTGISHHWLWNGSLQHEWGRRDGIIFLQNTGIWK